MPRLPSMVVLPWAALRAHRLPRLLSAVFAGTCVAACADDSTDAGGSEAWSIAVRRAAHCSVEDACWRTASVNNDSDILLEDTEGTFELDATAVASLISEWETLAGALNAEDCAPGDNVTEPEPPLEVSIVRGTTTVQIPNAWGCAGQGGEVPPDNRLGSLLVRTFAAAHETLACEPWEPDSGLGQPFQITENTPRFICLGAER